MGKNLIEMAKKTKKLSDGKSVGGRAGRLTRPTIDKLQNYYGKAIRRNVDRSAKSKTELESAIQNMQKDIKASLYHSVKLENNELRHQFCPKGKTSWCSYQKDKALGIVPRFENSDHHLDKIFLDFSLPIYTRLSDPKLLRRCVPGYSQNVNESLNGLVWNRCPKHKNRGFKQVEIAACSACLQFNVGATGRHEVMEKLNVPPGRLTLQGSAQKDRRVKQSLKRATKIAQHARQVKRNAQQKEEERRKRTEDVTYASGGFNEELV